MKRMSYRLGRLPADATNCSGDVGVHELSLWSVLDIVNALRTFLAGTDDFVASCGSVKIVLTN